MHGFELVLEAVRQVRGTSTAQAPRSDVSLVIGGGIINVTEGRAATHAILPRQVEAGLGGDQPCRRELREPALRGAHGHGRVALGELERVVALGNRLLDPLEIGRWLVSSVGHSGTLWNFARRRARST